MLDVIKLLNRSTEKKNILTLAQDQVIGQNASGYGVAHIVQELKPKDLSLLHLAIIVDTVHNHTLLYSLLDNHYYWFCHTVCDSVLYQGVNCDYFPNWPITANVLMPSHEANDGGWWKGILVIRVEKLVVSVLEAEFVKECAHYTTEVICIDSDLLLLTNLYLIDYH